MVQEYRTADLEAPKLWMGQSGNDMQQRLDEFLHSIAHFMYVRERTQGTIAFETWLALNKLPLYIYINIYIYPKWIDICTGLLPNVMKWAPAINLKTSLEEAYFFTNSVTKIAYRRFRRILCINTDKRQFFSRNSEIFTKSIYYKFQVSQYCTLSNTGLLWTKSTYWLCWNEDILHTYIYR